MIHVSLGQYHFLMVNFLFQRVVTTFTISWWENSVVKLYHQISRWFMTMIFACKLPKNILPTEESLGRPLGPGSEASRAKSA